jgi:3-methyladenine DNA glycosylase AlkD
VSLIDEVLEHLRRAARPDRVAGMARYGMSATSRMGVSIPELRRIAGRVGKDHALALALWGTGVPEARILASMVEDPSQLGEQQMERWVGDLDSWDVCDQVCMNLFGRSPLAWKKVTDWAKREEEFVRRAAFALLACLAWHDRSAADESFVSLLPLIRQGAGDGRNFVKKAVSWALRNIGKRNRTLNRAAIGAARELQLVDSPSARWVAGDALRELEGESVQRRFQGATSAGAGSSEA